MPTERVTRGSRSGEGKDTKGSNKGSERTRTKPSGRTAQSNDRTTTRSKPSRSTDTPDKPADATTRRTKPSTKPNRSSKDETTSKPSNSTRKPAERKRRDKPDPSTSTTKPSSTDKEKPARSRIKPESRDKTNVDPSKPSSLRSNRNSLGKERGKDESKPTKDDRRTSKPSRSSDRGKDSDRARKRDKETIGRRSESKTKTEPNIKERSRPRDKDTGKHKSEKERKDDRVKSTSERRRSDKKGSNSNDKDRSRQLKGDKKERDKKNEKKREETRNDLPKEQLQHNNIANLQPGKDVETLEGTQNSLESGISMTSPHSMSGDEVEIEESISSRLVEVDEVEEEEDIMEDEGSGSLIHEETSPYQSIPQTSLPPSLDPTSLPTSEPISYPQSSEPISFPASSDLVSLPLTSDATSVQNSASEPVNLSSEHLNGEEDDQIFNLVAGETAETVENTPSSGKISPVIPVFPDEASVKNIPEVPTEERVMDQEEEEEDYEDDFEDYESDFEDDSNSTSESSEESEPSSEESESSSDTSDLTDEETPLENHVVFSNSPQKSIMTSSILNNNVDTSKKIQRPKTSVTFVDFQKAKNQQVNNKLASQRQSRGEQILNMIELNEVEVELFYQEPISYEAFITSFGHSNRTQVSVQTNEDDLNEEIQTDDIIQRNKWTQFPPYIGLSNDELPRPSDYLGVGGDGNAEDMLSNFSLSDTFASDSIRLSKFLISSTQVMLKLLEEEAMRQNNEHQSSFREEFGFSDEGIPLGTGIQPLLKDRPCTLLEFCPADPLVLVSGYGVSSSQQELDVDLDDPEYADPSSSCLLCLWSIHEPSHPQHILTCRSIPRTCTFSPGRPVMVVAGLHDGTLALWDLREQAALHLLNVDVNGTPWKLRSPSFITACNREDGGEDASVVALKTLSTSGSGDEGGNQQGTFQVVSLSSDGTLAWWSALQVSTIRQDDREPFVSRNEGASPWSRVELTRSSAFNVAEQLYKKREEANVRETSGRRKNQTDSSKKNNRQRQQRHNTRDSNIDEVNLGDGDMNDSLPCFDLQLSTRDVNHLYVGAGNGSVVHCSRHCVKLDPVCYVSDIGTACEIQSIGICPHDDRYFLVGGSDGIVRLHNSLSSKPITTWQVTTELNPVVKLQWSPFRPCVFYILDITGCLHIWDLSVGDIFPIISIEPEQLISGTLTNFAIASGRVFDGQKQYYGAFTNDSGNVFVIKLSNKYLSNSSSDYQKELVRFNHYVDII